MLDAWKKILDESLQNHTCLLLVLSKLRKGVKSELTKVSVRPVTVGGELKYQLTYQVGTQQRFENWPAEETADRVQSLLRTTFEHCHLYTTEADYTIRFQRDGSVKIKRQPPSRQPEPTQHDRAKNYLIPEGVPCPFLVEIGVMTPEGRVRAARYDKFRQVNRFLELVDDVVSHLPTDRTLRVVDFGCGKSYLTFALHHLLTKVRHRRVQIIGVDRNADVIRQSVQLAEKLRCEGLRFVQSDIAGFELPQTGPVDLVVCLHACDTATDDALAKAVRWKTHVLLAVPCCQHELAKKIHADALEPIHAHGLLHERFASLATDALRALVLDLCGYKTQVTEFVDMEHTAKNVLIRAVRRARTPEDHTRQRSQTLQRFKQLLGLETTYLEQALADCLPS